MAKENQASNNSVKMYSYDVFDTCLIRTCGKPRIVFYLMALELYGEDAHESLIYDFVNARISSEKNALASLFTESKQDISILEIYSHFNSAMLQLFGKERLIDLELKIEGLVLRPIYSIKKEINLLHKRGEKVVYISDMYLPATFLKEQLIKHGIWEEGDKLYVSSEWGLTKNQGALFDLISEREKISFKEWHHCGDNRISDYIIPKKKGIRAKLLDKIGYSRYESEWLRSAALSINPLQGVLMAGIARCVRLSSEESSVTNMVADVIAPLFVPFVAGILETAKKRGINKIYFLARDADIFLRIAQTFKSSYPDIMLTYLYGSRRTFYLAGIQSGTKEEFRSILSGSVGRTPKQMIRRFNLDIHILDEALESYSINQEFYDEELNEEQFELFLDLLVDQNVLPKIMIEAKKQRDIARKYFKQEGMMDKDSKIAIVDLGWTRTCQKSIISILDETEVFGFYFGVFEDRLLPDEAGEYMAGFYPEEIIWSNRVDSALNSAFIAVAEQVFAMTDHGSTIAYKESGGSIVPVFDERENSGVYVEEYIQNLREKSTLFSKEYSQFHWLMTNAKSALTSCGLNSLYLFMEDPRKEETLVFDQFKVGNNLNDNEQVIAHLTPRIILQLFISKINSKPRPSGTLWLRGSISSAYGRLGLTIYKAYLKINSVKNNLLL